MRVYDSAAVGMRVIALFDDTELDELTKQYILQRLLFVDPEGVASALSDVQGLVSSVLWELLGIDLTGERGGTGERVFDWDQDEAVIKASLYQAYGQPLDELARTCTYRDLVGMMCMIPFETPLGQAIHYRTAEEPKPTKYNKEQVEHFRERKRFWRLKEGWEKGNRSTPERMEAMNNQASDMFAAMERAAKNGERRKRNNQGNP